MQSQPHNSYFLFINSSSGGGVGAKLLAQQKAEKISFDIKINPEQKNQQSKLIDVYFYNMKTSRQKGFKTLKGLMAKGLNTRLIVCGGDGSVMWVVSELAVYNINTQKVAIGIVPIGTGNDFSQYLNWGNSSSNLTDKSFCQLKKMIRKWEKSTVEYFDVWDVRAQVYEYGKFQKVENFQNKLIETKVFERSFSNYFSFGMDGKIGYSFDMHRTKSRIGNLAAYAILGLVKAMTTTKTIGQLVESMQIRPQMASNYIVEQDKIDAPIENIKSQKQKVIKNQLSQHSQNNRESKIVFRTKQNKKQKVSQSEQIYLHKDYYNIVALNIDSFMGGISDIWKKASKAINTEQSKHYHKMSSQDGMLQFVSFQSSVGMGAQRMLGGFSQRITQGSGPYYFKFKQYDKELKHRTYLQFDGEFIRFTHPKSVLIQKSTLGKNSKIKVLRNI